MRPIATLTKYFVLLIGALALFTAGPSAAQAAEVPLAGFTNGCFNCATPPNSSSTQTASLLGATYTNATFNGTTAGGFLGVGNNGQTPGVQNVSNLGSFSLSSAPNSYNGNSFTLRVTFTTPTGISGGSTTTFATTLTGTVISANNGGILFDFNNTPITFNFTFVNGSNQTVSGSFTLAVNDVSIIPGGTVPLTGQITGAQQVTTSARGDVLITEFRLRGTGGATPANAPTDEFVELYNNTDANISVSTTDSSTGWTLVAADGVVRASIPNGTVIPARKHYLITNTTGYSLAAYPTTVGGGATGDKTYTADIADNTGISLFRTATVANFTAANSLDAVGFGATAAPYSEGAQLTPVGTTSGQYSLIRKFNLTTGLPIDTNNNASDFMLVATDGATYGTVVAALGAPAPENLNSPVTKDQPKIPGAFIDPMCGGLGTYNAGANTSAGCQNRVIDNTSEPTVGAAYSLYIRRSYLNNTGAAITRLRFHIIDLTTLGNRTPSQADLRAMTSPSTTAMVNTGGASLVSVTINGLTLEMPPAQTVGGGVNSTLSANYITVPAPLANGAATIVQFKLARVLGGSYRFLVNVEALP